MWHLPEVFPKYGDRSIELPSSRNRRNLMPGLLLSTSFHSSENTLKNTGMRFDSGDPGGRYNRGFHQSVSRVQNRVPQVTSKKFLYPDSVPEKNQEHFFIKYIFNWKNLNNQCTYIEERDPRSSNNVVP
jgi:hypothetical protein